MNYDISLHNQSIIARENIVQFIRKAKHLIDTLQVIRYSKNNVVYFQTKLNNSELEYLHFFINSTLQDRDLIIKCLPVIDKVVDYSRGIVNQVDYNLFNYPIKTSKDIKELLKESATVAELIINKAIEESKKSEKSILSCIKIICGKLNIDTISVFMDYNYFLTDGKVAYQFEDTYMLKYCKELTTVNKKLIDSVEVKDLEDSKLFG